MFLFQEKKRSSREKGESQPCGFVEIWEKESYYVLRAAKEGGRRGERKLLLKGFSVDGRV